MWPSIFDKNNRMSGKKYKNIFKTSAGRYPCMKDEINFLKIGLRYIRHMLIM